MITSLHSSHVEAVKALLGARGVKARREQRSYVVEGVTNISAVIAAKPKLIKRIYYTAAGMARINAAWDGEWLEVSDQVMKAMTDTVTPQGLLAIVEKSEDSLKDLAKIAQPKLAYLWEIQDPGNAGTVIRAADAFGFDGVIFSENSVDIFSPKVIRATAGSLWQIKLVTEISLEQLDEFARQQNLRCFTTMASAEIELSAISKELKGKGSIWIFGNEARGIPKNVPSVIQATSVSIPMSGAAESLNLATAASVVMYAVANA